MRASYFILFISILTACSQPKSARSVAVPAPAELKPVKAKPATSQVSADWRPDHVTVTCPQGGCPSQVGILLFAGPVQNGKIPLKRCTAFLISGNEIMSNSHCEGEPGHRGFFVSQFVGGEKFVREVGAVTFRRYSRHPKGPEFIDGRPDVAIFQLKDQLPEITPLGLARGPQVTYRKLIAFAIHAGNANGAFEVRRTDCQVRRHENTFPYDVHEAPDMITAFGCKLESGTSGAPMFAEGSMEVETVNVGGSEPDTVVATKRPELARALNHWQITSTNIRCLDFQGARAIPCVTVTKEETNRRFVAVQNAAFAALENRMVEDKLVQAKAFAYDLIGQLEFEVMHTPVCRFQREAPRAVPYVSEHVKIQFDEWGKPTAEVLKTSSSLASTKQFNATQFEITLNWPERPGTYRDPKHDLRTLWGKTFHIDLPICPR